MDAHSIDTQYLGDGISIASEGLQLENLQPFKVSLAVGLLPKPNHKAAAQFCSNTAAYSLP